MQVVDHQVQNAGKALRSTSIFPRLKVIGLAVLICTQYAWGKDIPRADGDGGGRIDWVPCGENLQCGKMRVFLDYANPNAGTATLSLARYPATNKTARLGTLLTNPGGPGGSGVSYILEAGKKLSDVLDGKYDIVSWDPRGVNGTIPRVECFASETDQRIFDANGPNEIVPMTRNLFDPIDYAVFRSQVRIADAKNKALAKLCEERSGEGLRHVGTTTVVRDMELLYRTLEGEQEKVNFYGTSYGTVIGAYFVNMFPDRVGKIVLDGVVDPNLWANSHSSEWPKYDFVDSEKTLWNFFKGCAEAGPERCALASNGSTADDLFNSFETLLDNLYKKPLPVTNATRPGVLTEGLVRSLVFEYMYAPREWPQLATVLSAVLKGDGAPVFNETIPNIKVDQTKPDQTTQAVTAVTCADTPPFDGTSDDEVFEDMMDEIVAGFKISPHFASLNVDMCQHWRPRETDRFTGPFNQSLSNPILVIGNTADPITPVANARAVKSYLRDSARLVIQNGSGHCSSAMVSMCTGKAIKQYLLNNVLPQDGLECSTDEQLFPPPGPESGSIQSRSLKESASPEDLALFQQMRDLGEVMSSYSLLFKGPRRL